MIYKHVTVAQIQDENAPVTNIEYIPGGVLMTTRKKLPRELLNNAGYPMAAVTNIEQIKNLFDTYEA